MDQAEKLRNVIKLKNQKLPQKARVITVTSGKGRCHCLHIFSPLYFS